MRRLLSLWRSGYGASPLHLLALVASFALTGYAVALASRGPLPQRMLVWFLAAVVAHDLVLFPLYALADRSLGALLSRLPRRAERLAVPVVNHVRVPAMLSGLLLLVFWPAIARQGEVFYRNASGLDESPYLTRWLLTTGVAFAVSAVVYAVRLGRARAGQPA